MPGNRRAQRARTERSRLLSWIGRRHVVRAKDIRAQGFSPETLRRAVAAGAIANYGRGLYMPTGVEFSGHYNLAQVQALISDGVVCLVSALAFHEIGTQIPHKIWFAIDRKARKPAPRYPPLEIVRFSQAARRFAVREHRIDGQMVKITTPARTVADCFKYRNKIGIDVAMEALREYWRYRRGTMDELFEAARFDRVEKVLQPYADMIVMAMQL